MQFLVSIVLAGLLTLVGTSWLPPIAHAALLRSPATLPGLQNALAGSPPETLGLQGERFAPCPPSPNCVISQGADPDHQIEPIHYHTDRETAREALLKVLSVVPGTTVIEQTDDYIHTESASKLMGFVDDGEFYLPAADNVIEIRSAARLGESDLGVNRRRIEQIRLALADLGV